MQILVIGGTGFIGPPLIEQLTAIGHNVAVMHRGRKAATLTIVGFIILVASFLSVNLVFPGKHGGTFG